MRVMTEEEFFRWRKEHGFKRRTWPFAVTVRTPLDSLDCYVDALLEPVESMREAVVRITEAVFEPRSLNEFRKLHGVDGDVSETPAHSVSSVDDLVACESKVAPSHPWPFLRSASLSTGATS